MEKVNIAELLKDYPSGIELNCLMYEDVYFDYVDELNNIHCYIQQEFNKTSVIFNKDGTPNSHTKSKCVIFPKGKTTWEGFIPPCEFKDGDVCYIKTKKFEHIFIFKVNENYNLIQEHAGLCEDHFYTENPVCTIDDVKEHRLATEEEKQKLFGAIKANGYRWNEETKSLEKLPKFKDADILCVIAAYSWIIIYKESENEGELYKYIGIPDYPNHTFMVYDCNPLCCKEDISEIRLATEEEKKKLFDAIKENGYKWNTNTKTLEKLIKPKFKVGDEIVKRNSITNSWIVSSVSSEYYGLKLPDGIGVLPVSEQDDWELVPDKFDITTLKPFESKVLVRDTVKEIWKPDFFGCLYDSNDCPYMVVGGIRWKCCIPFEGNEHLLGTANDCNEYYKTWE